MENNSTLVTIAIPAYKQRYLKNAIESALSQTYENIEVIVVDDHSPENLHDIVKCFTDRRLKYYCNEKNIGGTDPVANWNKCLSYANGDFFCLLCDDDVYDKEFVGEMLHLATIYPATNVFRSRAKFIDREGQTTDLFPSSPEWESAVDYLWAKVSRFRIQTISEFMYRTSHIRGMGGFKSTPKAWCADDISVTEFAREGGIAHTNKILASFRISGENITSDQGHNVREKIWAENIYSRWVLDFVKDEPHWFKATITNHLELLEDIKIPGYLQYASISDLWFIFRQRHTDKYRVTNKQLAKSFYLRLSYWILNKK